ncbi:hypothetical protein [Kitasatospora herbaricolor]|uniref:hypothetical protein n=1 Tax=Kitasatospora herbaricolor TaxID=68217 RepID=UPI0036DEF14E
MIVMSPPASNLRDPSAHPDTPASPYAGIPYAGISLRQHPLDDQHQPDTIITDPETWLTESAAARRERSTTRALPLIARR